MTHRRPAIVIALGVERYSEGDDIAELPLTDVPKGWHITRYMDGGDYYFANDAVEFLDDPCPMLDRFRRDAVEMVNFLTQN